MKGALLLFVAVLALHPPVMSAAQRDCDTPYRGRYINYDHGYSFTVPKGYSGRWQSPCSYDEERRQCICMGSHGLYIALTPTSGINVFSSYPADIDEEKPTQARILASMVAEQREAAKELRATSFAVDTVLVKVNWARRISMQWFDDDLRLPMRKVSYQFVTHVYGSRWPSAELTVSLVAPEAEFETRLPLLTETIESFKWLRD